MEGLDLEAISRIGVISLLVVILYGGIRKWWVFGWHYEEILEREKQWREIAQEAQAQLLQFLRRVEDSDER